MFDHLIQFKVQILHRCLKYFKVLEKKNNHIPWHFNDDSGWYTCMLYLPKLIIEMNEGLKFMFYLLLMSITDEQNLQRIKL